MDTKFILVQLRDELKRITNAITALESLDGTAPSRAPAPGARGRRGMSPQARKRLSEMMKKRWAERKKGTRASSAGRHMSPAARRRISQMMKKRWAERKKRAKAA